MNIEMVKKHGGYFLVAIFAVALSFIFSVFNHERPLPYVTIAFLSVGQGDAIYIESPTHDQLIIDGGPSHSLLPALSAVMPWYDHSINAILVTNPDADHYAGFIDLFDSYQIDTVVEPGTHSDTKTYATFENKLTEKNIQKIIAKRGMVFHLGSSTDLTILYPDHDVSKDATNDGSIIAKLTYGSTSVMFTGDAPSPVEEYVVAEDGSSTMKSTILKVGHHGSRTSASKLFTAAVDPQYAVISAGLKNSYGFPHKETVALFNELHIPMLITFDEGTIIFHCDMKECIRQ